MDPRTTQLVGGPVDGHVVEALVAVEGDIVIFNGQLRYVATGNILESGHWEAVHDDMDPRCSLAAQELAKETS